MPVAAPRRASPDTTHYSHLLLIYCCQPCPSSDGLDWRRSAGSPSPGAESGQAVHRPPRGVDHSASITGAAAPHAARETPLPAETAVYRQSRRGPERGRWPSPVAGEARSCGALGGLTTCLTSRSTGLPRRGRSRRRGRACDAAGQGRSPPGRSRVARTASWSSSAHGGSGRGSAPGRSTRRESAPPPGPAPVVGASVFGARVARRSGARRSGARSRRGSHRAGSDRAGSDRAGSQRAGSHRAGSHRGQDPPPSPRDPLASRRALGTSPARLVDRGPVHGRLRLFRGRGGARPVLGRSSGGARRRVLRRFAVLHHGGIPAIRPVDQRGRVGRGAPAPPACRGSRDGSTGGPAPCRWSAPSGSTSTPPTPCGSG